MSVIKARSKVITYLSAPGAVKLGVPCALSYKEESSTAVVVLSETIKPTSPEIVFLGEVELVFTYFVCSAVSTK